MQEDLKAAIDRAIQGMFERIDRACVDWSSAMYSIIEDALDDENLTINEADQVVFKTQDKPE